MMFEIFPWNNNLETGIDIIDEQHKRLVQLLNKLGNPPTLPGDSKGLTV